MDLLIWKFVWKLKVPPKIKYCIGRACHEGLPTREALFRRSLIDDPTCQFCHAAIETTRHLLFACNVASAIWFGPFLTLQLGETNFFDFKDG